MTLFGNSGPENKNSRSTARNYELIASTRDLLWRGKMKTTKRRSQSSPQKTRTPVLATKSTNTRQAEEMRNTDGEGETEEARIPKGRPTQEIDRATDAERERDSPEGKAEDSQAVA